MNNSLGVALSALLVDEPKHVSRAWLFEGLGREPKTIDREMNRLGYVYCSCSSGPWDEGYPSAVDCDGRGWALAVESTRDVTKEEVAQIQQLLSEGLNKTEIRKRLAWTKEKFRLGLQRARSWNDLGDEYPELKVEPAEWETVLRGMAARAEEEGGWVSAKEIWARLGITVLSRKGGHPNSQFVGKIMRRLGWKSQSKHIPGEGSFHGYVKGEYVRREHKQHWRDRHSRETPQNKLSQILGVADDPHAETKVLRFLTDLLKEETSYGKLFKKNVLPREIWDALDVIKPNRLLREDLTAYMRKLSYGPVTLRIQRVMDLGTCESEEVNSGNQVQKYETTTVRGFGWRERFGKRQITCGRCGLKGHQAPTCTWIRK